MHTHGPWVFWKDLKGPVGKLIDRFVFPPKTIDTLLKAYLPKTNASNVAIGLCNYTADRFVGVTQEVAESADERKRLKGDFPISDIDTTSSDYFIGFKTSQGKEFYIVKGQEPHLPQGHLLLLPLKQNIETKKPSGEYKTPQELAQDAKDSDPNTLVFATHPGMKLSLAERIALRMIGEPSNETLGLTLESLTQLAEKGLLDGTEEYNSGAGVHNYEIGITTDTLQLTHPTPTIACSDTMYSDNILTSYNIMNLDFSNPDALSKSIRNSLDSRKLISRGFLKSSKLKQLRHFLIHAVTPHSHDYL